MLELRCPQCGALNRASAKFCKECRTPLLAEAADRLCPRCQANNRHDARFCINCRYEFEETALITPVSKKPATNGMTSVAVMLIGLVGFGLCAVCALGLIFAASRDDSSTTRTTPTKTLVVAGNARLTPSPVVTPSPSPRAPNTPTRASATPTRAPTSAPLTGDALDRAKRATVYIEVPLDATPGKASIGTGSIITARGHILTNNHLLYDDKGKAKNASGRINIGFPPRDNLKGEVEIRYRAVLVQNDSKYDLALLRITALRDGSPLPTNLGLSVLPLGDSDRLDSGDQVTILGYPGLGGDTLTLTRGTISGFLPAEAYIKTDAEINSGNSGGPAFNLAYEQIGIATAVNVRDQNQTVPGKLGLIRPINLARTLIDLAKREAGE